MHEGVVRGDVDRQRRRGLFHAEAGGLGEDQMAMDDGPIGDASPLGEDHLVTDPALVHAFAESTDDPARLHADLQPERRAFVGR